MPTLDNVIKNAIRILERQAAQKINDTYRKMTLWRGRKIVPLKVWHGKQKYPDDGEGQKYCRNCTMVVP